MLERERELAELAAAAEEARAGDGSVVLIAGEAGIGKSSLVHALKSVLPSETRLLVGYCDDLATPRVLGPLRDLIGSVGGVLTRALESGDRNAVSDALRAELDRPDEPTVLVVEDLHWADEATLDVLRFLVRRIASLPAVLVLSYRDVEITRDHPLQHLLGLASSTPRLRRLRPARLSASAVRRLGAHTGMDADRVFAVTAGNPFFVTEIFASGDLDGVPPTVAEAVAARLADLDASTRDALEQLAVIPSTAERWLVEAVVPDGLASLAAAERIGVLVVSPSGVSFTHELARRAVTDSMPAARRVACNQAVLAALLERRADVDLSRIVHHAAQAGAGEVIVEHGPAAAREASAAGSHREAVAHYRLVLDHRDMFSTSEQADLYDGYAVECYTAGSAALAVSAEEEAVALRRSLGDRIALGLSLRWLSRMHWWAGDRPRAEISSDQAIEVLEGAGDESALAFALSNRSQLYMLSGHRDECVAVGMRAVSMARELGDAGLLSHALNNVGVALWEDGLPEGQALLEESLNVALDAGEIEHACRAYVNLCWQLADLSRLSEAEHLLEDAIELADEAEFHGFRRYLQVTRGMVYLALGRWDEAEREALSINDAELIRRCPALVVAGLVRTRRGQDGEEMLNEAWDIAQRLGEAQRTGPAGAALLEAAWLRGDLPAVAARMLPSYDDVKQHGRVSQAAAFGYWLRLAGHDLPDDGFDQPYTLLGRGQWRQAADAWQSAGCPYEYALALSHSSNAADLLAALNTLDSLGAEPLARKVRVQLRELGVSRIPRGRVQATRENPAGLTERQTDVIRLLAEGLTNAEIAARLVLSVRTVDTHVAAILTKLDAKTRRAAATNAKSLGLL
ncbi:anaphase-promoting complex subunit 5 [Kribbella antiqua]|uniref:Anaphase-promoting complex subunit 5 n=1 Tax=Kribbella antiqua TaxID=2512217 RepID=A0A4R2IVR2_9ACTN|nr:AAA family ATPase [Kribbella antiqua]TCO49297.1 anaphase-promoting complex subunit 5 [Kribbella antiqua]